MSKCLLCGKEEVRNFRRVCDICIEDEFLRAVDEWEKELEMFDWKKFRCNVDSVFYGIENERRLKLKKEVKK